MTDPLLGEKGAAPKELCEICKRYPGGFGRGACQCGASSIPVPTSSTEKERKYAPHPLGAVLGPAAIKPRREEPLLVAEIIRLLERHGVPWEQAVHEAAGLMAQTVEEAEGWWAFEMADVESPSDAEMIATKRAESPSIPSTPNPELEAALDRYRDALMLPGTDVRTKSGRRLREGERESSRAALVSLYSRLQQELTAASAALCDETLRREIIKEQAAEGDK